MVKDLETGSQPAAAPHPLRVSHTPGPWMAVEPTAIDYRATQIQTDASLIAVCCGGGPKRAIPIPEERANARLIAAAPDLVEALRRVNHTLTIHGKVDADTDLHAFLRAALSKAGV